MVWRNPPALGIIRSMKLYGICKTKGVCVCNLCARIDEPNPRVTEFRPVAKQPKYPKKLWCFECNLLVPYQHIEDHVANSFY